MAGQVFSGALMPKKKQELQEIAVALKIGDGGTKDDLMNRIKRHLESNPDLEEDPSFTGLFGNRRRRSVQPQLPVVQPPAKPSSKGRRVVPLDPIGESTPAKDARDVSMFLKNPVSPFLDSPQPSPPQVAPQLDDVALVPPTPSSLPPRALSIVQHFAPPNVEALTAKIKDTELLQSSVDLLEQFRQFLSNSRNVWSATTVIEFVYLIYTVIPWRTTEVPLFVGQNKTIAILYPPLATFQTYTFWLVVLHWALPTVVIPAIAGTLISFSPTVASSPKTEESPHPTTPFDPLTAAIIRLAVQANYPYRSLAIQGADVLGWEWRVWNAAVGLLFAFSERLGGSPQVTAQIIKAERQQELLQLEGSASTPTSPYKFILFMSSDDTLAESSLRSASSLMALQLVSRLFTFLLNQAMFRIAPPQAYGTAAIQFELLLSTILFLSREGVRNTLLRAKTSGPSTQNLSVLPIILGFPLALVTAYSYAHLASQEVRAQNHFEVSIGLYALAAVLELMSEPMHNLAMAELSTGIRVRAEGLGITLKTVITFLVLVYDVKSQADGTLALIAFAAGQLAYGATLLGTYVVAYGIDSWLPKKCVSSKCAPSLASFRVQLTNRRRDKRDSYIEPELLRLSLTMTSQSLIKHFLTEGDKLILSWFSPLQDQGGYAVAVNYGSLLARIVFQPVEEAARGFFSKAFASVTANKTKDDEAALQRASTALITLLSVQAAFSLILVVFGTAYVQIVVRILLPRQYLTTSAPQVLSAWVWYIPVLAFNGGLEAFLSSVATPQDLNKQSRRVHHVYMSISVNSVTVGWPCDASLVYANILNLLARIAYTGTFITSFYVRHDAQKILRWKAVLPRPQLLLCTSLTYTLIRMSARLLGIQSDSAEKGLSRAVLMHIGVGGVLGLINLAIWWIYAGRYLTIPRVRSKVE
ncbi:hypothetical protein H0H93_015621 [Arthromyces matolae]|nr:hypothetical protein H0H93_015621 [Arthromyces matolae]